MPNPKTMGLTNGRDTASRVSGEIAQQIRDGLRPGGSFLLDRPAEVQWIWGQGHEGYWGQGEALIICGPNGTGKTTIGGQLLECRAGLSRSGMLLGHPVAVGERERVLYLAMDRPDQTSRALARLFTPDQREALDEHLVFWPGPPVRDLAKCPEMLAEYADAAKADTIIVDSLKDAALKLAEEETGGGWNRARQTAIQAGAQVLELHHPVKDRHSPMTLEDVFGSAWIVGGAGSVLGLDGNPGDLIVRGLHLKPNAELLDPIDIRHDPVTGRSSVDAGVNLVTLAMRRQGTSARDAASIIHACEKPTRGQIEKARRALDKLVDKGELIMIEGVPGGAGGGTATTYQAPG